MPKYRVRFLVRHDYEAGGNPNLGDMPPIREVGRYRITPKTSEYIVAEYQIDETVEAANVAAAKRKVQNGLRDRFGLQFGKWRREYTIESV